MYGIKAERLLHNIGIGTHQHVLVPPTPSQRKLPHKYAKLVVLNLDACAAAPNKAMLAGPCMRIVAKPHLSLFPYSMPLVLAYCLTNR